jgi:hypothetical protein
MARSLQGIKVSLLVVVWAPGNHRRMAGDEHLRGAMRVNVGKTEEREREAVEGLRRTGHSPERSREDQPGKGRLGVAGIEGEGW